MKNAKLVLLIVLGAALLAGCGGGGSSAKLASGDVAVAGGQHVSKASYDLLLKQAKLYYKQQGQAFPKAGTSTFESLKGQIVTQLVQTAELADKAASMGIKVTDADVAARLKQIEKQYYSGSEKKYLADIKSRGYTDAQVREEVIRPQLISEKLYDKVTGDVKVTAAEIHQYYLANSSQYTQAASRDVRYILVGKNKATAESVYQQLVAGTDQTWCTLAKKYAKDSSGQNCGKATFTKGQTVAAFDKVAFTAPTKKVHPPFYDSSQYKAWFVVEPLTNVKPAKTTPEKAVSSTIKQTLLTNKKQQTMSDWVSALTKHYCGGSGIQYATGYTPTTDPCAVATATTANGTTTTG